MTFCRYGSNGHNAGALNREMHSLCPSFCLKRDAVEECCASNSLMTLAWRICGRKLTTVRGIPDVSVPSQDILCPAA